MAVENNNRMQNNHNVPRQYAVETVRNRPGNNQITLKGYESSHFMPPDNPVWTATFDDGELTLARVQAEAEAGEGTSRGQFFEDLAGSFAHADKDKNGSLSVSELHHVQHYTSTGVLDSHALHEIKKPFAFSIVDQYADTNGYIVLNGRVFSSGYDVGNGSSGCQGMTKETFCKTTFSNEEEKAFYQTMDANFHLVDKDGDGQASKQEILDLARDGHLTIEDFEALPGYVAPASPVIAQAAAGPPGQVVTPPVTAEVESALTASSPPSGEISETGDTAPPPATAEVESVSTAASPPSGEISEVEDSDPPPVSSEADPPPATSNTNRNQGDSSLPSTLALMFGMFFMRFFGK